MIMEIDIQEKGDTDHRQDSLLQAAYARLLDQVIQQMFGHRAAPLVTSSINIEQ